MEAREHKLAKVNGFYLELSNSVQVIQQIKAVEKEITENEDTIEEYIFVSTDDMSRIKKELGDKLQPSASGYYYRFTGKFMILVFVELKRLSGKTYHKNQIFSNNLKETL